jgi:hypothetical protein
MSTVSESLRVSRSISNCVAMLATQLYRANSKPGARRQIRGAVMIVPDEDFTYQLPLD